jgi:hypothetical protein
MRRKFVVQLEGGERERNWKSNRGERINHGPPLPFFPFASESRRALLFSALVDLRLILAREMLLDRLPVHQGELAPPEIQIPLHLARSLSSHDLFVERLASKNNGNLGGLDSNQIGENHRDGPFKPPTFENSRDFSLFDALVEARSHTAADRDVIRG